MKSWTGCFGMVCIGQNHRTFARCAVKRLPLVPERRNDLMESDGTAQSTRSEQTLGGVQLNLWADIDKNASRSFMEKSLGQRRRGVVNDCFNMKMDADHYNETNPTQLPLNFVYDFTEDISELEAAMNADRKKGNSSKDVA